MVVPFKGSAAAKSRINIDAYLRGRLALAMLHDTLDQVRATPSVLRIVVVCGSPELALSRRHGVTVIPDPGLGLNGAIRAGEASARSRWPHAGVATCPGDLPGLDPSELETTLSLSLAWPRTVVPDRQGTGTTLLASQGRVPLDPQFGEGSFLAHLASGAVAVLPVSGSTLRHDVDRLEDLDVIRERSPGSRTARVAQDLLHTSGARDHRGR